MFYLSIFIANRFYVTSCRIENINRIINYSISVFKKAKKSTKKFFFFYKLFNNQVGHCLHNKC